MDSETASSVEDDWPAFSTASQGRSYDCNFCKRGFSNAQALGGHMNIHRKDRTLKPKKPNARGSQAPISVFSSSSYFPPSNKRLLYSWTGLAEEGGSQKPLPLFMEMPVSTGVENDGRGRIIAHELDLELRLGL
ncbi:hypothetical protein IEQ34_013699 [Dendrobium chrysotoxum]|uniref:C2H2-type domain-containing protein n=1 Tax=Dendrobium chrysotoxum TaxID=161865 RepID=A0AAV7G9B1_DENCH|nr:hypothetical protein IEQ34_013699 [Dendrobium chrysotoxum]